MKKEHTTIAALGIFFLFFIQMTGTLVESIYILDLLNTSLDEKVLGLFFFFSPFVLLFFGKKAPGWLFWISLGILLISRGVLPYLSTVGRLLSSGIGTAAALVLLPILLSTPSETEKKNRGLIPAQALALAVGLSVLLRTLNFTLDISLTEEYGWVGLVLVILLGALSPLLSTREERDKVSEEKSVISSIIGLMTVLTLVYFAFSSPGVIARWAEGNYQLIVIAVSLFSLLWILVSLIKPSLLSDIKQPVINLWNVLFMVSVVGTILAHTIRFPLSATSPPVVVSSPFWYQQIPLVLMLLLFPVIFIDFAIFAGRISRANLTPRKIAPGFLLGALLLVVLVFMNIFTNVWGYVDPVSGYFRNMFWLPFFLITGLITVFVVLNNKGEGLSWKPNLQEKKILLPALLLGLIFGITLTSAMLTGRVAPTETDKKSLTLMTYNIQQANDDFGEKTYQQQLDLMERVSPDIVALQESDSTRISLGNNDYVRYYANKLGYYSYFGPKTVSGTYGTAILSRYPIENVRSVFTFSDQDEIGTSEIEIVVGGKRFTIFNVHPDGSDEARETMIKTVLERAKDKEMVIALGDYNLRGWEDGYLLMDAVYKNAWMDVYPTGINDQGLDMSGKNRIDHIFVSPLLEVKHPVYLLPPESWTDHPAHWAEVSWQGE